MARLGFILCALILSGCNSVLPGVFAPSASVPSVQGEPSPGAMGSLVPPPLADLDCAPRDGDISCN